MNFFNLPSRTKVGRVIPKNAFDAYTNTKQKRQFTDEIQRITWTHKLSSETVNIEAKEIKEIQVFKVELKVQTDILKILEIINKAIPYHIIFWVEFKDQAYISTAAKHPHPTNEDISVLDWTFTSYWFNLAAKPFQFNLKGSLDTVFKDLCVQLTGKLDFYEKPLDSIVNNLQRIDKLKKEVLRLKLSISKSGQFKEKVQLNLKLKEVQNELNKNSTI